MKLKYLGTAAAEGIPAIFCNCATCKTARERGGHEIRTRSQALVDGKLLIDLNADTYMHSLQNNLNLSKVRHVLITHAHQDHLYPQELFMRLGGFAHPDAEDETLTVYGSAKVGEALKPILNQETAEKRVVFREIHPFETIMIMDYHVTAYPARHDPKSGPLFYMITDVRGKSLLYGHDTGYYFDEIWEALKVSAIHPDFISMDCTEADHEIHYDAHGNLERDVDVRARLITDGIAAPGAIFCLNHFSHNGGNVNYKEFKQIADARNFMVSYDGMEVDI